MEIRGSIKPKYNMGAPNRVETDPYPLIRLKPVPYGFVLGGEYLILVH